MKGKTVIITGENAGIGKEIAKKIAKREAKVILTCRNLEIEKKARYEIVEATNNQDIISGVWRYDHMNLEKKLQEMFDSCFSFLIRLNEFKLGYNPFRIEKIKVTHSLMDCAMDLKLIFDNECHLFLNSYFIINTEIKHLKFKGTVRILFPPKLRQKKVKIYFLEMPEFDFEVIGFSKVFKFDIHKQIENFIINNLLSPYEVDLY